MDLCEGGDVTVTITADPQTSLREITGSPVPDHTVPDRTVPGQAGAASGKGPMRPHRLRGAAERGSITLMLLVLFVALVALAGIVIDGGAKLNQAENANAIAQEAARAGAGQVDQANAYSNGSFTVDQAEAIAAAQQYLASAGYQGTVSAPTPDTIRVTVTVTSPTRILSIIGIDSMTSTGSATASLVTGVTGPGQ
jgi:Flp pilus assembly protein TadG